MLARVFLLCLGVGIGGGLTYYYQQANLVREQAAWVQRAQEEQAEAISQATINLQAIENLYNEQKAKALLDDALIVQYSRQIERLNDEITRLTGELTFYEEMIPAGPEGSLSLRAFEAHHESGYINFKLLLSLSGRGVQAPFKGRLQFTATGLQGGEQQTIELLPEIVPVDAVVLAGSVSLNDNVAPDESSPQEDLISDALNPILELNFNRLQRREGLLVVPIGFEPQELTVKVLEGNRVKLSRSITL